MSLVGLRKAIEGYRGNFSRMKLVIKFRIHFLCPGY